MRLWSMLAMASIGALAPALAYAQPETAAQPVAQEAVGLEVTPVSLAFGSVSGAAAPQRARVGLGGVVRFGRHRWDAVYWTPLQAGLFLAGNDFEEVISARLQTEVGAVFPLGETAFEAGLAAGPGILAVTYPGYCDGSCRIGGTGLEISPVVRYLFRTSAPYTLGAVVRAEIPAVKWSESCFGDCNGRAMIVLAGIEGAVRWPGGGP